MSRAMRRRGWQGGEPGTEGRGARCGDTDLLEFEELFVGPLKRFVLAALVVLPQMRLEVYPAAASPEHHLGPPDLDAHWLVGVALRVQA